MTMQKPDKLEQAVQLLATNAEKSSQTGTAVLHTWTSKQALALSFKWLLGFWGLGLVCLPIPIIHFVAVPACLLLGPIAAVIVYKVHAGAQEYRNLTLTCPSCQKPLKPAAITNQKTGDARCLACHAVLSVKIVSAS